MQKYLIAAVLLVSFVAAVLAAETFYIVFDATLHGCTIATAQPTNKTHTKSWAPTNQRPKRRRP